MPPLILILCTGNSCRSHLAEGILRAAVGDALRVASAGSRPAGYVHPLAIKVLAEIGIDISAHRSKHLDEFLPEKVETVITVCGNADQVCPMFPGQMAVPTISATNADFIETIRHAFSAVPKIAGLGKYSPKTIADSSLPGPPRSKPWIRSNSMIASSNIA